MMFQSSSVTSSQPDASVVPARTWTTWKPPSGQAESGRRSGCCLASLARLASLASLARLADRTRL
jgi:hypothetical protein